MANMRHTLVFGLAAVCIVLFAIVTTDAIGTNNAASATVAESKTYSHTVNVAIGNYTAKHAVYLHASADWKRKSQTLKEAIAKRRIARILRTRARGIHARAKIAHYRAVVKHRKATKTAAAVRARLDALRKTVAQFVAKEKELRAKKPTLSNLASQVRNSHRRRRAAWKKFRAIAGKYAHMRKTYKEKCARKFGPSLRRIMKGARRGRRAIRRRTRRRRRRRRRRRTRTAGTGNIALRARVNFASKSEKVVAAKAKTVGPATILLQDADDLDVDRRRRRRRRRRKRRRRSRKKRKSRNFFWKRQIAKMKKHAIKRRKAKIARKTRLRKRRHLGRRGRRDRRRQRKLNRGMRRFRRRRRGKTAKDVRRTKEFIRRTREFRINCGEKKRAEITRAGRLTKIAADRRRATLRSIRNARVLLRHKRRGIRILRRAADSARDAYLKLEATIPKNPTERGEAKALAERKAALAARTAAYKTLVHRRGVYRAASEAFWKARAAARAARKVFISARRVRNAAKRTMDVEVSHFKKAEVFDATDAKTSSGATGTKSTALIPALAGGLGARHGGPPRLRSLAAGSWDGIYGVPLRGPLSRSVVHWDVASREWINMPGAGRSNRAVAVECGGVPWRLNARGEALRLDGKSSWTRIGTESHTIRRLRSIAPTTSSHAWAIEKGTRAVLAYDPESDSFVWKHGPPTKSKARRIAAGCDGQVWLTTDARELFHLEDKEAMVWTLKGKNVVDISAGSGGVAYAVGTNGDLFEYDPATEADDRKEYHWFRWGVKAAHRVSVASDGTLVLAKRDGAVLKHLVDHVELPAGEKAHLEQLRGGRWEVMETSSAVRRITLGPDGLAWGTSKYPLMLLKSSAAHIPFRAVPNTPMRRVSQGCDRVMWGINPSYHAVSFDPENDNWIPRGEDSQIDEIAVCKANEVWAVERRTGKLLKWWPKNNSWYEVDVTATPGASSSDKKAASKKQPKMRRVACNCAGYVFAISEDLTLWGRINGDHSPWGVYGKGVKEVSASDELHLIDRKNRLFLFNLLPRVGAPYGIDSRWVSMHMKLRTITSAPDSPGTLAGIDTHGKCVKFVPTSISQRKPSWVIIPGGGTVKHMSIGGTASEYGLTSPPNLASSGANALNGNAVSGGSNGKPRGGGYASIVYGLTDGRVVWFDRSDRSWKDVIRASTDPEAAKVRLSEISVGCDGTVFGILANPMRFVSRSAGNRQHAKGRSIKDTREHSKNSKQIKFSGNNKNKSKGKKGKRGKTKKVILLEDSEGENDDDGDGDDDDILVERRRPRRPNRGRGKGRAGRERRLRDAGEEESRVFDFSTDHPASDDIIARTRADRRPFSTDGNVVMLSRSDVAGETRWIPLARSGSIVQVAAGSKSSVWGLDRRGIALWWSPEKNDWLQLVGTSPPPRFRQISHGCADDDVWGVTPNGDVLEYTHTTASWKKVGSGAEEIRVATEAYMLSSEGHHVYRYEPEKLDGHWVKLGDTALFSIATGPHAAIWATDRFNRIIAISDGETAEDEDATSDGLPSAMVPEHLGSTPFVPDDSGFEHADKEIDKQIDRITKLE